MATGDDDIQRLFRTHGAAVRRWALRFARLSCDAEDIVQEVFLLVHRRPDILHRLRSPQRWLLRATANVARHFWRTQARQTKRDISWELSASRRAPTDPLAELEAREIARGINEVLAALDERSAQIYRLSEVERLSTEVISALIGISPQTVRVRRFRTRSAIARRLAVLDDGAECCPGRPGGRYDSTQARTERNVRRSRANALR